MASNEEIKANVLKLQSANATPSDIESYVKLATKESVIKPTQPTQPIQPKSIFKTIEGVGERVGDAATNFLFPKTLQKSLQGVGRATFQKGLSGAGQQYRQEQAQGLRPTDLQTAGGALQGAAGFATLATSAPARFGARVVQSAALGAGFGAGGALESGGNVAKGALTGAALGGAIPAAGKVLGGLGEIVTEQLPKRLIQSTLGQSKKSIMAGRDLTDYVLKSKKVGTANSLLKESETAIKTLGDEINKNIGERAPRLARILKNEVTSRTAQAMNKEGAAVTTREIAEVVDSLAPQAKALLSKKSLSLTEANTLRQSLDRTITDRGFLTSQLPFKKEILRKFAHELREKVKNLAPKGTRELFDELAKEIQLRNTLTEKYAVKNRNEVLNAFDLILAGGGALGGGLPGAVASVAVKKFVSSPLFKTGAAQILQRGSQLAPALKGVAPIIQTGLLKSIPQATQQQ